MKLKNMYIIVIFAISNGFVQPVFGATSSWYEQARLLEPVVRICAAIVSSSCAVYLARYNCKQASTLKVLQENFMLQYTEFKKENEKLRKRVALLEAESGTRQKSIKLVTSSEPENKQKG